MKMRISEVKENDNEKSNQSKNYDYNLNFLEY
jgi:hypothetical protein